MGLGVDGLVVVRRGADGAVAFGVVVRTGHYPSLVSVRSTQAGLAPSTQPVAGSIKPLQPAVMRFCGRAVISGHPRSEEHTSELQSLMRISYAVFCLKKKTKKHHHNKHNRKYRQTVNV